MHITMWSNLSTNYSEASEVFASNLTQISTRDGKFERNKALFESLSGDFIEQKLCSKGN